MHKLTFYPLGNADSCLIELEKGKMLLFDYANLRDPENEADPRIDLSAELHNTLEAAKRDYLDVVAFTHGDDDHIHGSTEFFHLEHADKYQGDGRIKIRELWVPAAMILEDGVEDECRIFRTEARHRLKRGEGIRVFSRPDALAEWLANNGTSLDARRHLITNAGGMVPGFDKQNEGVEMFVHSPFSQHCDEQDIDRNTASLVMQLTFDTETKVLMTADTPYDVWQDIVKITKAHKNDIRLAWDVYKLPHHCSYTTLAEDKGKTKTEPVEEVKWLLDQAQQRATIVSTSDPIPNEDTVQPPHMQAHNCYKDYIAKVNGEFIVTMEHPSKDKPAKLVINIDRFGASAVKSSLGAAAIITSRPAPRAG
jgi:hypothetical protein